MVRGLTPKTVENFRPKAQRFELRDKGANGLYLIVQPSGAKSWAVRYRFDGQPRKLTLGPAYVQRDEEKEPGEPTIGKPLTLAAARKLAATALHRLENGVDPAADKKSAAATAADRAKRRKEDSVEALARLFLKRYAQERTRESSWREYARILGLKPAPDDAKGWIETGAGVLAEWRGKSVHDITKRDVIALLDGIVDRGATVVANRTLAVVRKWFNWLVSRDVIQASPCTGVEPPSEETERDRVLSNAEIRWFWRGCEEIGWPFGPLAKLLLLTGQRRDEVGEMRWSEVDLSSRTWTIPRGRMKGDSEHAVPLSDAAVAILRSLPRIEGKIGLVFTTSGTTAVGGYSRAKARLDGAMERAAGGLTEEKPERRKGKKKTADKKQPVKIPPWRFHDLRRTCATGMAKLGVAVPVIERMLAHTSGTFKGIVGVYQQYDYAAERPAASAKWGAFVERLIADEATNNVVALRGERK